MFGSCWDWGTSFQKELLASLEKCWHSLKELLKCWHSLKELLKCWYLLKELLKSVGKLRNVLALAEGAV